MISYIWLLICFEKAIIVYMMSLWIVSSTISSSGSWHLSRKLHLYNTCNRLFGWNFYCSARSAITILLSKSLLKVVKAALRMFVGSGCWIISLRARTNSNSNLPEFYSFSTNKRWYKDSSFSLYFSSASEIRFWKKKCNVK